MLGYFRFYTSEKKRVRGRQLSDASKATTCTKKPAQKPAVSTKSTTARGKGGRVKKGCATTPLEDTPTVSYDDDEDEDVQEENTENTQTEKKKPKGKKKSRGKVAKAKGKEMQVSECGDEENKETLIGSVQKDADIHKIDSESSDMEQDNVRDKHKTNPQTKPVKKDSDKPKGDKKDKHKTDAPKKPVKKDSDKLKDDKKDNKMDAPKKLVKKDSDKQKGD